MSKFYEIRHRSFWVKEDGRVFNEYDALMSGTTDEGYPSINLRFIENGKIEYVCLFQHRMVAELFVPNPNNKPFVIHLDGDKAHNKAENLAWATYEERYKHQDDLRLYKESKLTKEQVSKIKKKLKKNIPKSAIALEYGVSHTQIKRIALGENWAHTR
jgi:HNH endonuclease